MKKNIIKTACVTAATALMLGVFATPQTEVFNQTVNTQAKTIKTKYKNGKTKTKVKTTYYSKKLMKKYRLPSRLKSQEITHYNTKGQITYKKDTWVYYYKKFKTSSKHVYTYKKYRNIKNSWINNYRTSTYETTKHYWKKYNNKKFKKINDWTSIYNTKDGGLIKRTEIDGKNWTGKKFVKAITTKNKKGNNVTKYYHFKKGKYRKISLKTYNKVKKQMTEKSRLK